MRKIAALTLTLAATAGTAQAAPPVCAAGGPAAAAHALYGAGTTLTSTGRVAGLRSALALQPLVHPGTRRRMLLTPAGWCDAAQGFNHTGLTGRRAAVAFAKVAAAPYFDGVRVFSARETAPGTWALRTHANTNGVVARWTVVTDASGVVSATWTATDFARHPLTKEWEGLTALPGATETYVRGAGGALAERRGLDGLLAEARAQYAAPGVADYVGPDGMTLSVSIGDTHVAVDPGVDVGEYHADIVRWTLRSLKLNYEDFLSWGFTKGWNARTDALLPDRGFVSINDALSLYCTACVLIGEEFNIHFLSEFPTVLAALGYTYEDDVKAFDDVMGHEMFHNFQNRYNKPGQPGQLKPNGATQSYSEGTARMQETLHSYSDVNRTADTLYHANDTNGCNGYDYVSGRNDMNAAMATGPFGKSYNTCYFWTAWYGAYGHDAFVKLVTEGYPAQMGKPDATVKGFGAAGAASGATTLTQLKAFAAASLTGKGRTWSPPAGGEAYDWGQDLERWTPATIMPGATATATLSNGGMMARELTRTATVSLDDAESNLFVVRDGAGGVTVTGIPRAGSPVAGPAAGERVWVVAARPSEGQSQNVTLSAS